MNWKSIVGTVAPTLATALGGPLAGMAVKFIGDTLGLSDPIEDNVAAAIQAGGPELLLKLKQADQDFAVKMKELDIRLDELEFKDRDSARTMFTATRARTPSTLSWLIVVAAFSLYGYVVIHGAAVDDPTDQVLLGRILGTFDTLLGVVVAFWLGTTHANKTKDDTIKALSGG